MARTRTTKALLDRLVNRVNILTGNPTTAWDVGEWDEETQSVKISPNVGNYHVARVTHGYRVEQMQEHGTSDPLGSDHLTAHEVEVQLRAYIAGLESKHGKT